MHFHQPPIKAYDGQELAPVSVQQNVVHPSQHAAPPLQLPHLMTAAADCGRSR